MLRLLSDEDFNGRIVRGLFRQCSGLELVRTQDVGLQGAEDSAILKWAKDQDRVLLTHDARSMPRHVRALLASGGHVPGVVVVDDMASIGECIEHVLLIAQASKADEWQDQIIYVPLK
jgi:predicted nuclease of predicted toxin-antitoxin system